MSIFKKTPKIEEKKRIVTTKTKQNAQQNETYLSNHTQNTQQNETYLSSRAFAELNCFVFGNISAEIVNQPRIIFCKNTKQVWPFKYSPMKGTFETIECEPKTFKTYEDFQKFLDKSQKKVLKIFFFANALSNYSIYWPTTNEDEIVFRIAIINKH